MKKIIESIILLGMLANADNLQLPFVGKAWFNFAGGNGTNEYVIIKNNGYTEIGACGLFGCGSDYKGSYKKLINVYHDGTYYKFSSTHVSMVSKSGNIIKKCNEDGIDDGISHHLCTQELSFDYKQNRVKK